MFPISFGPRILGMSWGCNSSCRGYNPSYPFIRPFLGVITPFITRLGAHLVSKTFVFFGPLRGVMPGGSECFNRRDQDLSE